MGARGLKCRRHFFMGQKTKHEADRRKHLLFAADVTTVTFIKNIKDQPIAK